MKKYKYAFQNIFCKTQEDVNRVLNEEVYKLNPEDITSLQILPYFDAKLTSGFIVPICWYVCYVFRYEIQ